MDYSEISQNTKQPLAKPDENKDRYTPKAVVDEVTAAKMAKKSFFRDTVIPDIKEIAKSLWTDLLKPTLKNVAMDTISMGAHKAIFKDGGAGYRSPYYGSGYNYSNPSYLQNKWSAPTTQMQTASAPVAYNILDSLYIDTPERFNLVRQELQMAADHNGAVTLRDLMLALGRGNEIIGNWQADNVGWTANDLLSMRCDYCGGMRPYKITMPQVRNVSVR